jgi:uncharacterized protein YegL
VDQKPFIPDSLPSLGTNDFANNPEPRCPCLLVLDKSGSMGGAPINELNAGLQQLKHELLQDELASKRTEVAVVSFGPITVDAQFQTAHSFAPPMLEASGDTPMGAAIRRGLELLNARKQEYRANGVVYYRPWVFLITDGAPTDEWVSVCNEIRQGEASKAFTFFAIGVQGANFEILKQLSPAREPLKLQGLMFREFFSWLSTSMSRVSASQVGTAVALPSPAGWGSVAT